MAISRALRPIVRAQGTDRLATFVQEGGEIGTAFAISGAELRVTYQHPERTARGTVIVEEDGQHVLVVGTGFEIRPFSSAPETDSIRIQELERGYFVGDRWVATATVTQETHLRDAVIKVVEGSVHRFRLSGLKVAKAEISAN